MERGVVAAEFRLDAVVGDAVDQDGCHMERGVPGVPSDALLA
jgi:hypothetical protein